MLDQLLLFIDSSLDILLSLILLGDSWSLALTDNVAWELIKAAINPLRLLLVLGLHSLTGQHRVPSYTSIVTGELMGEATTAHLESRTRGAILRN